jgi:hypothetical protein
LMIAFVGLSLRISFGNELENTRADLFIGPRFSAMSDLATPCSAHAA